MTEDERFTYLEVYYPDMGYHTVFFGILKSIPH